jgi:CheY-like chemotaxis protein
VSGSLPRLDGVCVLVVDDEADAREVVRAALLAQGAEVCAVASADEALALLPSRRVDVLLSDIGMPGVDGYALMRRVRALEAERGGGVAAVALTAYIYARAEDARRAFGAGFQSVSPAAAMTAKAAPRRWTTRG